MFSGRRGGIFGRPGDFCSASGREGMWTPIRSAPACCLAREPAVFEWKRLAALTKIPENANSFSLQNPLPSRPDCHSRAGTSGVAEKE